MCSSQAYDWFMGYRLFMAYTIAENPLVDNFHVLADGGCFDFLGVRDMALNVLVGGGFPSTEIHIQTVSPVFPQPLILKKMRFVRIVCF